MKFWNEKNERLDRDEIEQIQLEKLQSTLNRVYKNVSHYKKIFKSIDFVPDDLRSLMDFKKLPFTTREDLINNYPYGMFAVPLREVVRLQAPTLILDKPVVMGFTKNDLKTWAELIARNFTALGINKDDVIQVSMNFGVMAGTFGIQLGSEIIGASVIPMSGGKYQSQVKIMRDFRTSVLVSTPTVAMSLAKTIENMGLNKNSLSLRYGIFGLEPCSEELRKEIEERLNLNAFDSYGISEVFVPGVAWECNEKKGLHVAEDHFIPEIIDPKTLSQIPPGEEGELVLTTISKEAFPLIRFRTGDMAHITYDQCACGRTHCRISRTLKRCDDRILIRGISIIPGQIGNLLEQINKSKINYQLLVERNDYQDYLTIIVEISDQIFFDQMKRQSRFIEEIHHTISEFLGWEVQVKLVEPGTLKPDQILIDKRKI